jgi:hypothetical protein
MIRQRTFFITILILLLGLQSLSLAYYLSEQRVLAAYVGRVADPGLPRSEQVKAIVLSLKDKSGEGNEGYFLLPVFRFLRPTPWQVIENGGDCGDRSRLVIGLLRLRGIRASKWALYNAEGESKHAVVQADVESGDMVVDPLFGIWFPKSQGGYYGIRELRQDPGILTRRIEELRAKGLRPGAARLDFYEFNNYIYSNARTINWNKSFIMKSVYWALHGLLGARADEISRPSFVEEPPLMVIYGVAVLELVLILAWLLMTRRRNQVATKSHPSHPRSALA